jgi:phosphoglycerate dehydrogenase-like enzyme
MKAVLYGTYPACELPRLKKFLHTRWELVTITDDAPARQKAVALADADALVASKYRVGDPRAPKLRLLQCSSTGTEKLDFHLLPPGCAVCNVFGHELGIAEYVMWAILDWSVDYRHIPSFLSTGTWSVDEWVSIPNHCEAFEKTIGIVGFGHIGREVARRAKAFGMKVISLFS